MPAVLWKDRNISDTMSNRQIIFIVTSASVGEKPDRAPSGAVGKSAGGA
jgi:hypothetical protein